MPPKKRKKAGGGESVPQYMWLLQYEQGGYDHESRIPDAIYSSKEKAIAALPHLMDAYANVGDDWKNGLEGFGKEADDPYLSFEYTDVGEEGGVLLTNKDSDTRNPVTVYLKRLKVDPPNSEIKDDQGEDSELTAGGFFY